MSNGSLSRGLWVVGLVAVVALALPVEAGEVEIGPLMRFPDVQGDTVVFVHGEDIWSASTAGGLARRLTVDEGEERHPKLSPDGALVAFTAEYDGNPDVYVMNADGSDIRRVTYHPYTDEVQGWHPASGKILFRSNRNSYSRFDRLFLIAPDGTGLEELPLHEAGRGAFSPDGTKIVYNRIAREDRTWKRYKGGTAQDLWLYDFATGEDRKLTEYEGTDRLPMWIGDTIYFASDRERVLNIFALDPATGSIDKVTDHLEYDARRPSAGGDGIVYELGGALWLLDTATRATRQIPIEIRTDARAARPYLKDVTDNITSVDCSPSGARALITARGEVFTVPKEHGPTRNLTMSSGARDKDAAWSPDGNHIAFISDMSGEYEIYVVDAGGAGEPVRLTEHQDGYRHTLRWSPDSTKIAFADQTLSFYYVDVETHEVTKVDQAEHEAVDVSLDLKPIHDFAWSPDSRWLAYSKMGADLVSNVYVYSLESGAVHNVSSGMYNDFGPVFSSDGEHLFFVSNRRFDPTFCDFEWEMVYKKTAGIYSLVLRADGPALLPLRSDEETAEAEESDDDADKGDDDADTPEVRIDFAGIADRIEALPVEAGNYRELAAGDGVLLYLDADEGDFNRFEFRRVGPRELKAFCLEEREESTVLEGVTAYRLSTSGTHLVYRQRDTVGLLELKKAMAAKNGGGDSEGVLDLGGLTMTLDPRAEWRQIFDEAWRLERDFFYDDGMHGLDWAAVGEKYSRLLDHASCPQDLTFLIGELIGELATSHTYVYGRDLRRSAEGVSVGMLGADFEVDEASGRFRIAKIYDVPEWTRGIKPPLARPGVDVREGDYLLAVNGREITADREIYASFQNTAGTQVRLMVNDRPTLEGAREAVVEPLSGEFTLRYLSWVEHNRRVADEASDGRIGYIHLPDTYTRSASVFPQFYSLTQKEGLIVDGRFNGGGLDPDIFLQRLAKRPMSYWTRRYSHDQVAPTPATTAHMVCITNRQAGSGGDELPFEFRQKGLGPVIGTRTWGGLVGVSMFMELIDGGGLTAPDYRIYTPDGDWVVENEGVSPDIEVELDPAEMARGHDAQLAKAIEILLAKIEAEPRPAPTNPPFPRGL